jgi:hypothetical protein
MIKAPLGAAALAAQLVLAAVSARPAAAQPPAIPTPRPSPNASVSQTVGVTEITLHYSRPGVKGRVIWGKLVPYGEVWRTGANENTTISFSTPVKLDGKELPAGTYGLQTLPTAGSWTVILSKDADQWGAFSYNPAHDALRLEAKPRAADFQEWMEFEFSDLTDTSATLALRWEKLRLPIHIEVDTPRLVAAKARSVLRWQTPFQAASYCLQSGSCLDDAARWLDASIDIEPTFANQRAKAMLLAKRNDLKSAVAYGEKALAAAKAGAQPPPADQVSALEAQVAQWKGGAR